MIGGGCSISRGRPSARGEFRPTEGAGTPSRSDPQRASRPLGRDGPAWRLGRETKPNRPVHDAGGRTHLTAPPPRAARASGTSGLCDLRASADICGSARSCSGSMVWEASPDGDRDIPCRQVGLLAPHSACSPRRVGEPIPHPSAHPTPKCPLHTQVPAPHQTRSETDHGLVGRGARWTT